MRGVALIMAVGGVLLATAGPALADGGLEVNPSTAYRGQTIGISTGDNCRDNDGTATVYSKAFGKVQTTVREGEADVSVTIRSNVEYDVYSITLTCHPSNRKISGAVTVKKATPKRCWQDSYGKWHGKCYHRGPETGFGGSLTDGPTPMALAGFGLLGTASIVAATAWMRRGRV
ncbi:hypothetical protein [Actinocorallia longicatena]|uniref:Neocarzinostatin family protein n=1 Tax=Actinocorallia longicatena TaxID=111803 RepID=A0ABP6PXX8_9ACTN